MFKSILVITVLLWTTSLYAQKFSISGTVRDDQQNEVLSGATVEIENASQATITDERGNFTIGGLSAGNYSVIVRFLGYAQKKEQVNLRHDIVLNFNMTATAIITEEVVVYATRANDKTPTTFTHVNKQAIQEQNFGQDIPMLLNWTPSIVTT